MPLRSLPFLAFLCLAPFALADVTYDVTINTSSISGTSGALDFNFNPGPLMTQPASLQILDFMSDGTLAACAANIQGFCPTGDVTGTLPGTLTFDNGSGLNDYFTGFTFGSILSFEVRLYGPAVASPDGTATSGSTFAFSMFSDAAGTVPALTTDTTNGFAATIDVNLDGTTTVNNSSSQTTISPLSPSPGPVPEPSSLVLLATVMLAGVYLQRQRAHRKNG